ncbi:MAG TPA: hypothetical protein VN844_07175 [Pyrinomonadaceae bacterium]|nr:hypothetical protein [Pyrinomonadaceae bacterium]
MTIIKLSLLAGIVVFSTACPKYRPTVDFKNPGSFVNKLNAHLKDAQHNYECYRFGPNHIDAQGKPCTGFTQDLNKAKAVRNELLENALPFVDEAYEDFVTDLQAGRDRANFVADIVELSTTAAVGITNGERPLQIMGIALTAFRGGRRSADLNYFKEQTTPVLITKMDGNRAKVRATILTREQTSVDQYPLGAAISDIVDYYNAGTLVRAFTELQKDTAFLTRQSENEVLVRKGVITPEITAVDHRVRVGAQDSLQRLLRELNDPVTKSSATKVLQNIVVQLEGDTEVAAILKKPEINVSSSESDGVKLRDSLIVIRRSAQLVNNTALLNKIDQAIVEQETAPRPAP